LRALGLPNDAVRQAAADGAKWLADLQNGDGGVPTFCKGWGALPFDRSSPDITAHAVRAWVGWLEELPFARQKQLRRAIRRGLAFLAATQKPDGAWIPLWFGHQEAPNDENPLYGTARVLRALASVVGRPEWTQAAAPMAKRARNWLLATQKSDGGWAGACCAQSSVEETALAVESLASWLVSCANSAPAISDLEVKGAVVNGARWLTEKVAADAWREPAPIGFYFARLWYYDRLYPLIFVAGALAAAEKALADSSS
jgi:squalene-hopene/tetraprenyl-beta-curcumene cyclase